MDEVTAKELKNRTGAVLEAVGLGHRVVVTRHGRPVALIVPFEPWPTVDDYPDAWAELEAALDASEPAFGTWQEAMHATRERP